MNKINPKFIKWIQTPAGCDGGNIYGSIWMFGIEWGGDFHQKIPPSLTIDSQHGEVKADYRTKFPSACPYNTKITKLYSAIIGVPTQSYKDIFHATNMFSTNSDTYKGNIFTIGSPRDANQYFGPKLQELTGCLTKKDYIQVHKKFRFPMLREWVVEHRPKVIVCFGIGRAKDFCDAFSTEEIQLQDMSSGDRRLVWGSINSGNTLLFICPHVSSANGLNSDERLSTAGYTIATKSTEHFGPKWHKFYGLTL